MKKHQIFKLFTVFGAMTKVFQFSFVEIKAFKSGL